MFLINRNFIGNTLHLEFDTTILTENVSQRPPLELDKVYANK